MIKKRLKKMTIALLCVALGISTLTPMDDTNAATTIYTRKKVYYLPDSAKIKKVTCGVKTKVFSPAKSKVKLKIKSEKKYTIKYVTAKNKRKTCYVYADWTKPTVSGVKNNREYESKVNIKVSDKVSGVASVTLNGKKMSNKFTVSEAGDYKLVAKDKCNNKTVVNFSVIEDEPEETPDVVTAEPNPEDFETPSPEPTEDPNGGTVVIGGTSTPVATSATTTDAPKGTATPNVKTTASPAPTAKETEKPETPTATPTMAPTVVPATPTPVPDDLAELDANWKYTVDAQNKKIQLDKYIGNSPDVTVKGHYYIEGYSVPAKLKKTYYDESRWTFYGPFVDNRDIKTVTFMDGYVIENDDADYLFYGCSSLEKVNGFEGTYTSLRYTFCHCTKFNQEFTIPADVEDLKCAFFGCETLEKMPKISKLSKCKNMSCTFSYCKKMIVPSNFEFPVGVSYINSVFESCEKLYIENLKIPDSVIAAGGAFRGCKLLKSAEIGSPNSELQFLEGIFENCTSLTNVKFYFEKNMETIQGALKGCSPGVNVEITSRCTKVGDWKEYYYSDAFKNCKISLTIFDEDKEAWNKIISSWEGCTVEMRTQHTIDGKNHSQMESN